MKYQIALLLFFSLNAFAVNDLKAVRSDARMIIKKHLSSFAKCYAEEVKNGLSAEGKVVVAFSYADKGTVTSASIQSSELNNTKVEECLISNLKKIEFEEAPKGLIVDITYPFIFKKTKQ